MQNVDNVIPDSPNLNYRHLSPFGHVRISTLSHSILNPLAMSQEDAARLPTRNGITNIVYLKLGTGARISEVVVLQWKHLDLQSPVPTLLTEATAACGRRPARLCPAAPQRRSPKHGDNRRRPSCYLTPCARSTSCAPGPEGQISSSHGPGGDHQGEECGAAGDGGVVVVEVADRFRWRRAVPA